MALFRVKCLNSGNWDGMEIEEIEALDEKEAAEMVCGEKLVESGKAGQHRAQVSPASSLGYMTPFWSQGKQFLN